jgi:hypothetical protein
MSLGKALGVALGYLRREELRLQFDADLCDMHKLETMGTTTASQMRGELRQAIEMLELLQKAITTMGIAHLFDIA